MLKFFSTSVKLFLQLSRLGSPCRSINRRRLSCMERRGTIQMLGDDWAPEGYELWQNSVGAWQKYYETDPHWQWTEGLRHLVECIQKGEQPAVTAEHAFHVLEIMLAAQASGRTGQAQNIESTFSPDKRKTTALHVEPGHRIHDRRRE